MNVRFIFLVFKVSIFSFYLLLLFSRPDVLHHFDTKVREDNFPVPVPDDVAVRPFKFIEKGNNVAFMNVRRKFRGESFLSFSHVYYFFNTKVSHEVLA